MFWDKKTADRQPRTVAAEPRSPMTGYQLPLSQSAIRCPLCGSKFAAGEALACTGCALANKCGLVMCPNCSYEFAP